MSDLIAPPEIFSAHAVAAFHPADYGFDGEPDPMLAKGTHLRIFAGTGQSFPITPFVAFRIMSFESEAFALTATGATVDGQTVFLENGKARIGLILPRSSSGALVRVDLMPEGGIERAALQDPFGRLVQMRTAPGWQFAAPVLQRLRIAGGGPVRIVPRMVNLDTMLERQVNGARDDVLGLPAGAGLHRWYIAVDDDAAAFDRVERGAPLLLTPMDRPDGPFDLPPGAEVERVAWLLREFPVRLPKLLNGDGPPWAQEPDRFTATVAASASQTAHVPAAGMLQMACVDPGVARYFGFAGHYEMPPELVRDISVGQDWDTFAVLGLFALDPQLVERLALRIEQPDAADPHRLISLLVRALQRRARDRDIANELALLIRGVQGQGLVVAPFVTLAAPVLPPLAPTLAPPEVLMHLWQTAADRTRSSDLYRVGFAFPHPPMAAMVAMRRDGGDGPEARHRLFDTDTVPDRAVPRLLGYEREANSRHHLFGRRSRDQRPAGRLADENIPASDGVAEYRFAASDIFGRFGPWTDAVMLGPPPRPVPPAPILNGHVERRTEGLETLGPLSMGTLRIAVAVPSPAEPAFTDEERLQHGRMIIVPRLDELPAGALPLKILRLQFDSTVRDVPIDQPGMTEIDFVLPELEPPNPRGSAVLTGCFLDSEDNKGPEASRVFEYVELRPPPVQETGIGLYWTSAPGPAPDVEIDLKWRGQPGASYRVYLTDAVGLGLEIPSTSMSRGEIAVAGCNHVRSNAEVPRDRFRLLNPEPIQTAPDDWVWFASRLPRTLTTVQFLRVVPVGPDGGEPSFSRCAVVPLAVPDSHRPSPPRVDGSVDPTTGSPSLSIVADGFNLDTLAREEPGLFNPGAAGSEPPQFRLRHSIAPAPDPLYARIVGQGAMTLGLAKDGFQATWVGDPLEPFVRHLYWAEVRLPPERCGVAGLPLVTPPNGIAPPDERRRQPFPRPFSRFSAVRMLVHLPPDPPSAVDPTRITVLRDAPANGKMALTIKLADPPRAHPNAIDGYRLAVWSQWPDGSIEPGNDVSGRWPAIADGHVAIEVSVPANAEATETLLLKLGVVDPAGRLGAIVTIEVPGAERPGSIPHKGKYHPRAKGQTMNDVPKQPNAMKQLDVKKLQEALAKIAELAAAVTQQDTDVEPDTDVESDELAGDGHDHDDHAGCRIKQLPDRLLDKSAAFARRVNPLNAPLVGPIKALGLPAPLTRLAIAVMTSKYWGPAERTLTVSFMEPTAPDLRARIVQHLNAWSATAGIFFEETTGVGDVRISLGSEYGGGYWSYLGTDIKLVPVDQPTMNLEGFSMDTPESEYRRVVRHEAGHTLGFPHEHMRKELIARIDPSKAYAYFQQNYGWDQATVDAQVLTPLDDNDLFGTPPDATSIMCYQLPGSITFDGQPILGGTDINPTDYFFAGWVYPKIPFQQLKTRALQQSKMTPAGVAKTPVAKPADVQHQPKGDWGAEKDPELPSGRYNQPRKPSAQPSKAVSPGVAKAPAKKAAGTQQHSDDDWDAAKDPELPPQRYNQPKKR
jgi:hypothetical protein